MAPEIPKRFRRKKRQLFKHPLQVAYRPIGTKSKNSKTFPAKVWNSNTVSTSNKKAGIPGVHEYVKSMEWKWKINAKKMEIHVIKSKNKSLKFKNPLKGGGRILSGIAQYTVL